MKDNANFLLSVKYISHIKWDTNYAETIKKLRKNKKVSLPKLAESTTLPLDTLRKLENVTKPLPICYLHYIEQICQTLGYPLSSFFSTLENTKSENKALKNKDLCLF